MIKWIKQLFCKHNYVRRRINVGYYDEESWYECTKCGRQKDFYDTHI